MRDLDQRALGIAVEQQVGLGVEQDRAAHLVGPVIVMGDAAQRRLDAAEHDRRVGEGLAAALGVDDDGAIRPFAALAVRRVGIIVAQASVRGVAVDHRIHIAGGDAEKQIGLAQRPKGRGVPPVGLGDDADAKTLRLEQAADDRHAEARMIDIGVAGDEDHVAGIPAERLHLRARHGQEGRDAEAMRPIFAVGEERLRALRFGSGHDLGGGRLMGVDRRQRHAFLLRSGTNKPLTTDFRLRRAAAALSRPSRAFLPAIEEAATHKVGTTGPSMSACRCS